MSLSPGSEVVERLRAANARLRELLAARDGELAALRVEKDTEVAQLRGLLQVVTLRVAELERRQRSGSDDSGTPSSKEPIASKARRKAERKARRDTDTSSRERSADRSRGGQPGHPGRGLSRDPDPQRREQVRAPRECRGCGAGLSDVHDAGMSWSQTWDVRVIRWRTEYLLPRRQCVCRTITTACPPGGGPVNGICYGPVLNSAAVALTAFGNVPVERSATLAGDAGTALRLVDDPDERIGIPAPARCGCGRPVVEEPVVGVRRRQVHDLAPQPAPVVTEYAAEVKCCPGCAKAVVGAFPAGVNAPTQYGPEITARVADVVVGHHVPVYRSTVLVMELLGMAVSTGFAASLRGRAAQLISGGGFLAAVQALLASAPVVHADETFARAAGKTAYVHVACTDHLTLLHTGDRSAATIDAGGVLTELKTANGQVLVRDGYVGYTHLKDVLHAWCGAHLLRDLRGIHEADPSGQMWARAMADTLLEAHRLAATAREQGRATLNDDELGIIGRLYTGALARARTDNPATATSVLAGHARTLAARFATHRVVILRFTTDLAVGFTNNVAERAVRPVKVQQRSSGGAWRTLQGLADFAVVQSYLSTANHWGISRFEALHQLFTTGPWIPTTLTPHASTG